MANLITWENVLKSALSLPLIKVNRQEFLFKTFAPFGNTDKLQNLKPQQIYSPQIIEYVVKGVIKNHTTKATVLSTIAGIPGGYALAGTILADMAQYYGNFLALSQKLAYIYGWPDLMDEDNNLGEDAQAILTIFMGLGLGVEAAQNIIEEVAKNVAKRAIKKIPQMALTKTAWYPIIKKIAIWITGKALTRESFAKGVGKLIPLIGGPISGGITYFTFKPMAKKLNKSLYNQSLLINGNG